MKPILLGPNQPLRFYRGGPAIARFRGLSPNGDRVPEDWVGSTTAIFGDGERGLTVLPAVAACVTPSPPSRRRSSARRTWPASGPTLRCS